MEKLNEKTKALIMIGIKQHGTYDPDTALAMVEEQMTIKEAVLANDFLAWVHKNGKGFGTANIDKVFAEFKKSEVK